MATRHHRALRIAISGALALLTVSALAAAGIVVTTRQASTPTNVHQGGTIPVRPYSKGPIKVAIVLGSSGTVVSDALAPYEVFASSPQFSVYTVAAAKGPARTQGGPSVEPTYTFADSTTGVAPHPDVVVVPAVGTPDGATETQLRNWVKAQAQDGALVLGVCNGAGVLAAAGMLDGRAATAHWSRLGAMRKQHPGVQWVAGQRFVQDGPITTTAGVTSGIPGALHVMAELAGPEEATRVGRTVHYPNWSVTAPTTIPTQSLTVSDLLVGLNVLLPWQRPTLGIALRDGVDEIDLASSFEVFDVSYAALPVPVSATGTVTTMHGMVLRTNTTSDRPTPSRLAVPGPAGTANLDPTLHAWAIRHHVPVDAVQGSGNSPGFDGALQYLSRHAGRATAVSAAKMIDYPSAQLRLDDTGGSFRIALLAGLGLALVAVTASLPTLLRRCSWRSRPW